MLHKECRSISTGSRKIQKKIMRECRLIKVYWGLAFIASFATNIAFLPVLGDEDKFIPQYVIIKRYFGHRTAFSVFLIFLVINTYITNIVFALIIYPITHIKFQFYLLQDYMATNNRTFNGRNEKIIFNRLKEFSKSHVNANR